MVRALRSSFHRATPKNVLTTFQLFEINPWLVFLRDALAAMLVRISDEYCCLFITGSFWRSRPMCTSRLQREGIPTKENTAQYVRKSQTQVPSCASTSKCHVKET